MISKEMFVETIKALEIESEHYEYIIVKLLEKIFNDNDLIDWWIYEKDFGRNFQKGDLISNGKKIDLSTAEKFYDYLMEETKSEHEL